MTPDKSREELSEEKRRFWKQHIFETKSQERTSLLALKIGLFDS